MTIHKLLTTLREQDGAMLGRKSLALLSAFVAGYALAQKENKQPTDEIFLNAFNGWVAKKLKNEGGQGWDRVIAFNSASEAEEWKLFWKLYDEYTAKPAKKN